MTTTELRCTINVIFLLSRKKRNGRQNTSKETVVTREREGERKENKTSEEDVGERDLREQTTRGDVRLNRPPLEAWPSSACYAPWRLAMDAFKRASMRITLVLEMVDPVWHYAVETDMRNIMSKSPSACLPCASLADMGWTGPGSVAGMCGAQPEAGRRLLAMAWRLEACGEGCETSIPTSPILRLRPLTPVDVIPISY